MRLTDGEEIDSELGKKLILLFELPTQPYYQIKEESPKINVIEPEKRVLSLGQIWGGAESKLAFPAPPPLCFSTNNVIPITFVNK
jgi:hypothetical protein